MVHKGTKAIHHTNTNNWVVLAHEHGFHFLLVLLLWCGPHLNESKAPSFDCWPCLTPSFASLHPQNLLDPSRCYLYSLQCTKAISFLSAIVVHLQSSDLITRVQLLIQIILPTSNCYSWSFNQHRVSVYRLYALPIRVQSARFQLFSICPISSPWFNYFYSLLNCHFFLHLQHRLSE
jgi:hypothetical protein